MVFEDTNEAGIRVVVRNAKREVIAPLSEKIRLPSSVEVLEVIVARRETQFIVELDIPQSVFEGDSEVVCNALAAVDFAHLAIGQFIKDIISIASTLRFHSFSHTRRQSNFVAYALAKRVRLSFPLLVWMESVLPNIFQFVVSEFSIS